MGSVVQRFTATDDDLGLNAALQYSLVEVHPNGDIDVSSACIVLCMCVHTLACSSLPIPTNITFFSVLGVYVLQDFFSIQQYTGDVSVARSLSLSSTYELIITASVRHSTLWCI